jgi:lipopolysaccharide biosynthesis regulator YciM
MSFEELVTRWDTFLGKLNDRYFEVMQQAEGPLNDVINNLQFDNVIIHNVKTGLHNQTVIQLTQKAEEGWDKMDAEMLKYGKFFWNQKSDQHKKLDTFRQWIDIEFQKFEIGLYARAARKILDNVKHHIDEKKMHKCTQCGAELPINVYSFMAVNIKCDSCGSVNTYQPDDRIRALEYYVLNHLADEKAMETKLRAKYDKNAQKEYYKIYYGFLMETVPDKKEFYQRQMDERLTNPMFTNF